MSEPAPLLLVASTEQLPPHLRVWGTGGWANPEQREALDWLTLARALGWGVELSTPDLISMRARGVRSRRWVILAADPETLPADVIAWLCAQLEEQAIVVIGRAGMGGMPWSDLGGVAASDEIFAGHSLRWLGESPEMWECREPFSARRVRMADGVRPLADVDGSTVAAIKRIGRGAVVSLAFHPSAARDVNGAATAMLRRMMIATSLRPVAWIDLSHAVALRMDDPGAAQSIYLESWKYPQLDRDAWSRVGAVLETRRAKLSVAYVSGWVDDGDTARGTLSLGGESVERCRGSVHPSPEVVYREAAGSAAGTVHDYAGQYRALRSLQAADIVDVELHGYTHMTPDLATWAAAADRYESVDWYRELGQRTQPYLATLRADAHPLALGIRSLERYFDVRPSTLVCPGDQWTNESLEAALTLGLHAVSSYYLALRFDDRFCWAQHLCAPYLNEPDAKWFDSGLPIVGYFHDREPSLYGAEWLAECLDAWSAAGARRFITLRELTCACSLELRVSPGTQGCALEVDTGNAPVDGVSVPIRLRMPGEPLPREIEVRVNDAASLSLPIAIDGTFPVPLAGRATERLSVPFAGRATK